MTVRCESCRYELPEGSRFCSQCGMPTAELITERRPLTVLIYDLVDYTQLASGLDPEDVQHTIRAFNDCGTRVIQECGGMIARYAGDGSLAYFGVPQAREDDARYAIEAGLALVDAVSRIDLEIADRLHTRVGIATGEVVVGDVLSHGAARELTAHGEALPLAARLQSLAEPDQVVVCPSTHDLAAGYFQFQSLGPRTLKGFTQPVTPRHVVAPRSVEGRFAARLSPGAPLVGRHRELGVLDDCFGEARGGRGRVVFVSGDAGIGKSRVVDDFRTLYDDDATPVVYLQCSAEHQATAFHPLLEHLRTALTDVDARPGASVEERVHALLAEVTPDPGRFAAVVAEMLGLGTHETDGIRTASEAEMKADFTRAMLDRVDGLTESGPTIVIVEDAHWIDPSTFDFLRHLSAGLASQRLLVLVTSRQTEGLVADLGPNVAHVMLAPLPRAEASDLIESMASEEPLEPDVVESILDRAAGVPLFIEELARAAIDAGADAIAKPNTPEDMPLLVRDALVVRLDRLGAARRVARTASAIGREFTRALLETVSAVVGEPLTRSLVELERAGVIQRVHGILEATYTFRHDLLRSAAYDLMLRDERADLHARIASAIETHFADIAQQQPERLARHYGEAGFFDRSIEAWQRGGRRAAARSSFAEAITAYTQALDLLDHLPEGRERDELSLQLRLGLGEAHAGAAGFASPPAGEAYAEALEQADRLDAHGARMRAYTGLFGFHHMGGRLAQAREVADRFTDDARAHGDLIDRMTSHRVHGVVSFSLAEFDASIQHLERAIDLYDEAAPAELERAMINAQDQKTTALCYLPLAVASSGDPERAWQLAQAGIAHSQRLGHVHSIGYSLTFATGLAAMLDGREADLADLAGRAMEFARDEQFPNWRMARVFHGLSISVSGSVEEGLEEMRSGFASYGATGGLIFAPIGLLHLARALELAMKPEEAIETLERGLGLAATTGEIWCNALLLAFQGDVLARMEHTERAASAYQQAIDAGKATDATLFELRGATGLARLHVAGGRSDAARSILEPLCDRFAGRPGFPELTTARELLAAVA